VEPTIVAVDAASPALQEEVFAPIMYVVKVASLEEAIALNNAVPQGLSSALFTRDPEAMFKWTGGWVNQLVSQSSSGGGWSRCRSGRSTLTDLDV